jgi:hypothetical protein
MRFLITLFLFAFTALAIPHASFAQIGVDISVSTPPPAFPVYEQPAPPAPDYIWQPGYWAYDPNAGYYWVPATWAQAPQPGLLWTPPYWGYENGVYAFHDGYWGPHVGFYGGIDYGYGYGGFGFHGGQWRGDEFVNLPVHGPSRGFVSFNGPGGIHASPRPQDLVAAHDQHFGPTEEQRNHIEAAHQDRAFFANENHGHPAVTAVAQPGAFEHNSAPAFNREDYNTRPLNFRSHPEPVPAAEPQHVVEQPRAPAPQVQRAPVMQQVQHVQARPQPQQQHAPAPRPASESHGGPRPDDHGGERGQDEHGR